MTYKHGMMINDALYPTCLTTSPSNYSNSNKYNKELYYEGRNRLRLYNYLSDRNMLYSEQYLDKDCYIDIDNNKGKVC